MAMSEENIEKKKAAMLQALEKALGVVSTAAQISGVSRASHYKWLTEDKEYAAAVKDMEDVALDFTESKLFKNIEKGKETSIIFYLKTRGQKRGYIEKLQTENITRLQGVTVRIVRPGEPGYDDAGTEHTSDD